MKGGSSRTGHPRSRGAALGMRNLGLEHICHGVGGGPHALADLTASEEPRSDAHVDVPVFVRDAPRGLLDASFGQHGPVRKRGVDFVASAIEEARVDENASLASDADAFSEVHRSAPLLVHYAQLDGVAAESKGVFHGGEQIDCNCTSSGPCSFGLTTYIEPLRLLRALPAGARRS